MKIIDLNGAEIVIKDLDMAIANAEYYLLYHSEKMATDQTHKQLFAYWNDIYQKLNALH